MANLNITMSLDNAAFQGGDASEEVARILAKIASRFDEARNEGTWLTIFDSNGNDVGRFQVRR